MVSCALVVFGDYLLHHLLFVTLFAQGAEMHIVEEIGSAFSGLRAALEKAEESLKAATNSNNVNIRPLQAQTHTTNITRT